jgi:hypothetical protein
MQDKKYILGLSSVTLLIIICAAAKFTIHILTASNYGYFCNELYTIALSKHLAFGYVDLPPLNSPDSRNGRIGPFYVSENSGLLT